MHLAPIRSHPPPPRPHRGHLVPSTPPPVLVTVGRMIGTVGDAGNPFFRHRWPRLPLLRALPWAPLASWLWTSSVLRPSFQMSACIGRHRPGQTKDRVGTRAWDRNLEPTPSSAVLQTSLRSWVIQGEDLRGATNRNADLLVMGVPSHWAAQEVEIQILGLCFA